MSLCRVTVDSGGRGFDSHPGQKIRNETKLFQIKKLTWEAKRIQKRISCGSLIPFTIGLTPKCYAAQHSYITLGKPQPFTVFLFGTCFGGGIQSLLIRGTTFIYNLRKTPAFHGIFVWNMFWRWNSIPFNNHKRLNIKNTLLFTRAGWHKRKTNLSSQPSRDLNVSKFC